MKIDAHYYAVLAFCRAVGFNKKAAHTVAYASQFVDDAKINHIILAEEPTGIEYDRVMGKPSFFNMATCHSYFRLNTFNYDAMINNTTAFHFVPGCKGENFSKKLRCSEESPVIVNILEDVLGSDDLVKLGMVLHAYADTFAHQGFSGLLSKVNAIKDCNITSRIYLDIGDRVKFIGLLLLKKYLGKIFYRFNPAYGHSQALSYPDIPYLKWEYKYDYSDEFASDYRITRIDNSKRYKRGFDRIKEYLADFLASHPLYKDENFQFDDYGSYYGSLYDVLLKKAPLTDRIKYWQDFLIDTGMFNKYDKYIIEYDENLWLKQAFRNFDHNKFNSRRVEGVYLSENFAGSNWYKYYLAVRWYKEKFYHYTTECKLNIPR